MVLGWPENQELTLKGKQKNENNAITYTNASLGHLYGLLAASNY